MKLFKTYLFDFDYTLADSSKGIVMCYRHVLDRHHHTGISDEEIKRTIGKTLVESFSILSGITDSDTLEAYRKEYVKEADVYMTANTRLFPETAEVLTALKARGAQIGIISTKYRYRIMNCWGTRFLQVPSTSLWAAKMYRRPSLRPKVYTWLLKSCTRKKLLPYI